MTDRFTRYTPDADTLGLLVVAGGVVLGVAIATALPDDAAHVGVLRMGVFAAVAVVTGYGYRYVRPDGRLDGPSD